MVFYLNSPVDELTGVHRQPRQIHGNVPAQGRALSSVLQRRVDGPDRRDYKKPTGQRRRRPAAPAMSSTVNQPRLRSANTGPAEHLKTTQVHRHLRVRLTVYPPATPR